MTTDLPCCHVKTHNLKGCHRVHSVRLKMPGGGEYRLTIADKTLIDPDLIRVEVLEVGNGRTLIQVLDHKGQVHQFWVST